MSTTKNETNGTVTKTRHRTAAGAGEALAPGSGIGIQTEIDTQAKDEQRLATLESAIKKNWKQYLRLEGEIADALAEIKSKKLWRHGYAGWGEYCQHVLKITARSANRALNAHEVRKIQASIKKAAIESSTYEADRSPGTGLRDLNKHEVRSLEGVPEEKKKEAVQELMQTPAPARTPRMPPPREVVPAEAPKPIEPEPEVQKPVCPLDNDQLHWVVLEIENWYQLNKAAVNSVPPPTPMALVSKIQRHLQNLKR